MALPGACPPLLLCPACPSLHAWQGRCTLTSGVAPCVPGVVHWVECSRWKDKSAAQCQGYSCEVLNRLVRDILCCTGNVSDFFGKAVINFLALLLPGMGHIPALALNSISSLCLECRFECRTCFTSSLSLLALLVCRHSISLHRIPD